MKILLVEDDPKISSFIRIGLESHKFIVDVVYTSLFGEKLNDKAGAIDIPAPGHFQNSLFSLNQLLNP